MSKKFFVVAVLISFFHLLPNKEIYAVNFELEIARSYTFLDKQENDQAALIARKLSKKFPLMAEPYVILATIHIEAGLYDLALVFLNKAEDYSQNLLYTEEALTILELKAKIYRIKNELQLQMKYLNEIGTFSADKEGIIYQKKAAEAFFELGEINYKLEKWGNALDFFLKAIKNDYPNPLLPYLYLTHYYSEFSQGEINLHFQDYLPKSYQVIPQKENSFLFYYKAYRQLLAEQNNEFLMDENYRLMHENIKEYFLNFIK